MSVTTTVLGWVLPMLLGPVVYIVMREILNASRKIDDLPPFAKRLAVAAVGTGLAFAVEQLGLALPVECANAADGISDACATALTAKPFVKGVTAAGVAMILHMLKKAKPND